MRRIVAIVVLLASPAAAQQATAVIDRVAASAGQQVVTLSAIRRALRLQAVFAIREYVDSPEERRRAANRLIDQSIILREIELSRYTGATMADTEAVLVNYLKQRGINADQLREALARYGFTEEDFRQEIQWRVTVQRFVDFRFAPGVQVSDADVQEYYQKEFVPALQKQDPQAAVPPLDEVTDRITRVLTTRKTNVAMEQWLALTRETLKVRFFDEAFK
jgi:parvulin-like peptidyl-prolyl isomerase